jgi:predicted site-specific integrase-resolvase
MLTLGQAAKLVGRSKTALTNAIKSGRLSATRLENGSYNIDPSELYRVYSPVGEKTVQTATPVDSLLRELLEQVKSERDDLKQRLNDSDTSRQRLESELTRLTLLLTHQPKSSGSLWNKVFKR